MSHLSSRLSLYPSLAKPVKTNADANAAEERIVGGVLSDTNEFPETVAIIIDKTYFCGGIIISKWTLIDRSMIYISQL